MLMHNPVQAHYCYASQNYAVMRISTDGDYLTDYVKRFKQSFDVLKSHISTKWLEEFVEHTDEYKNMKDVEQIRDSTVT